MMDAFTIPHGKIRRTFRASDASALPALFERAGLPEDMRKRLEASAIPSVVANELIIFPSLQDIETMTPSMQEVIYPVLATPSLGQFYSYPILITTKTIDEWFRGSKLRPNLIEKIKSMSYKRGGAIAFSAF